MNNPGMTKLQLAIERLMVEEGTSISITPCLGTDNQVWQIDLDNGVKAIYRINEMVEEAQFIAPGMEDKIPETSVTAFLRTKRSKEDIYNECRRAYDIAMNRYAKDPDDIPMEVDLSCLGNEDGAILLTKKNPSSTTLEQQCSAIDPKQYPPSEPFDINDLFRPDEPFEILETVQTDSEDFDIDVVEAEDADFHLPKIDANPVLPEPKEVVLADEELVEIIDETDPNNGLRRRNLANEDIARLNAPIAACLASNLTALRDIDDYDNIFIITPNYVVDAGPKSILMRYVDPNPRPLRETDEQILLDILYKIVDFTKIPVDRKYEMEQRFESGMTKMGLDFLKMLQFLDENEGGILAYSDAISPAHIVDDIFPRRGVVAIYSNDASMVQEIASCVMKKDPDKELSMRGIDIKAYSLDSGELKVHFIGYSSRKAFMQYADAVKEQFDALSRTVLEGNNQEQYHEHVLNASQEAIPYDKLGLSSCYEFENVPTVPDVKKMAGIAPNDAELAIQRKIQKEQQRHLRLVYNTDMRKANGE